MESITIRQYKRGNMDFYVSSDFYINQEVYEKIVNSDKFERWVNDMEKEYETMQLSEVHIQSYDMFGSRLGFVKFLAKVVNKKTDKVYNSVVFMRGDAVAVLVILNVSGKKYILVTRQPRIPVARSRCVEICAGMLENGENDPSKVKVRALKEMEEELKIKVGLENIVDLTSWANIPDGVCLSQGGCDERMKLFFVENECSLKTLASINNRATGTENEDIIVNAIPFNDWIKYDDSKLRLCIQLYQLYSEQTCKKR